MEINFHRLRSLFSSQKEWQYKNGQLVRRFKKSVYVGGGVAAIFVLALTATMIFNILKKDIIIVDGGRETNISTFKSTVAEVLAEKGIEVGPDDRLMTDLNNRLADNMKIEIKRAKPVMIITQERDILLHTLAETVGQVIQEAGVTLGSSDKVDPGMDTPIDDIDKINIVRVEERVITQTETIPFENEIKKNENLEKGLAKVIRQGKAGKKETSIKVLYENGVEAKREVIAEKIIQEPVAGIIEEGTKTTLVSSRGTVTRFVKAMEMVATAYDATYASTGKTPDHPQYGITRSGLKVRHGIVAVDPSVIPLGTWLYVEGYGEALAADTGGAIKGNRIDLYFDSPSDVAKYGKKKVKVYILDKPKYKF
ncbi:3D domain-containing protein [Lutispora thermophila]|uniref:G5 domain-containing protein n=1 Tax=Lutispora thermophila DSM 19022 TaxID=1122184 RepID=A0A1M6BQD7_9FIRM|nr:3D domain-containing protein [Lutispora thermophila]SHI50794.1 protein of unknown function [Lutispora thermophila DSM 19022]